MAENLDLGRDGILASLARLETSPSPLASPSPIPTGSHGHHELVAAPAFMPRPPALVFEGHQRGARLAVSLKAAGPPVQDSSCSSSSDERSVDRVTRRRSGRRISQVRARRSLVYVSAPSLAGFLTSLVTGLHQFGAVAA